MVEVASVSFSYKKKPVLKDINFNLKKGDSLSILGANGCGKSTLLKCILGLLKFKGNIKISDKIITQISQKELSKLVAYIPQTHAPIYEYLVFDVVLMGRINRTHMFGSFSKEDKIIATKALDRLGIFDLKDVPYTQISGGQRQLVYIARALAQDSKVLLLDEPTNGLDFGNQIKLLNMIKSLSDDGHTIIQTTHNPSHAKFATKLVMFLKDSTIMEFGNSMELVNCKNISKIYSIDYKAYEGIL